MNIYEYAILAIMGIAIVYLVLKVRQPVVIRRERKKDEDFLDDIGEIGDVLREMQPEIVKGLKLKEDQQKSLANWINTVDKVTKSKILKWVVKKVVK